MSRALNPFDVRFVSCAAPFEPDLDTPLLAGALVTSGARVDVADWRDASVDWSNAAVTMLRSLGLPDCPPPRVASAGDLVPEG